MSSPILSPLTWRPAYLPTPLVDTATGQATTQFDRNLRDLTTVIAQLAGVKMSYFGASGNGRTDNTSAFQQAIGYVNAQGGGIIYIDEPGTYMLNTIFFPAGAGAITLVGQGNSTILQRLSPLAPSQGLLDISASNVTLQNFLIDGSTLVSVGLQYGVDFSDAFGTNDPMAASLNGNSSIWLHGPLSNFTMEAVTIQHTGGYAVLVDGFTGTINDVDIIRCTFLNNRPHLFGVVPGQLIYGSWTGGIYINGDGRTAGSGVVNDVVVSLCNFERGTGNQVWSHVYGFNELHTAFRWTGNYFLDIGLDAMEPGGLSGGIVSDNFGRRIGYTTVDDTSQSIPRWLNGLNATALDSSGLVKGCPYVNNSFISVNGGMLDLDGHADSTVSNNVCRIPYPTEEEYAEDQIAISGATNSGSTSYGINANNSSMSQWGGQNVQITGNMLINLAAGSIRLYASRNFNVVGNTIIAPDVSIFPPIGMGPTGPGPYSRCYGNKITANMIVYNPASAVPAIFEDNTYSAFLGSESNTVCNNVPLGPAGTSAIEFAKSVTSGSVVYSMQIWFP